MQFGEGILEDLLLPAIDEEGHGAFGGLSELGMVSTRMLLNIACQQCSSKLNCSPFWS